MAGPDHDGIFCCPYLPQVALSIIAAKAPRKPPREQRKPRFNGRGGPTSTTNGTKEETDSEQNVAVCGKSKEKKVQELKSDGGNVEANGFNNKVKDVALIKSTSTISDDQEEKDSSSLLPAQFKPPPNILAWLLPNFLLWAESHDLDQLSKIKSTIGSAIVCIDGEDGLVRALHCIRVEEFRILGKAMEEQSNNGSPVKNGKEKEQEKEANGPSTGNNEHSRNSSPVKNATNHSANDTPTSNTDGSPVKGGANKKKEWDLKNLKTVKREYELVSTSYFLPLLENDTVLHASKRRICRFERVPTGFVRIAEGALVQEYHEVFSHGGTKECIGKGEQKGGNDVFGKDGVEKKGKYFKVAYVAEILVDATKYQGEKTVEEGRLFASPSQLVDGVTAVATAIAAGPANGISTSTNDIATAANSATAAPDFADEDDGGTWRNVARSSVSWI
ncbi:hypothetical protein E2P81_ATG06201 [Venturia nashicola]|nr:hypothetical protein E2P81_ATG06201 [Venturia nashicola]